VFPFTVISPHATALPSFLGPALHLQLCIYLEVHTSCTSTQLSFRGDSSRLSNYIITYLCWSQFQECVIWYFKWTIFSLSGWNKKGKEWWDFQSRGGEGGRCALAKLCHPFPVPQKYINCMALSTTQEPTSCVATQEFPAFYETQSFIIKFTRALHLSLSWASAVWFTCPHSISPRSTYVLDFLMVSFPLASPPIIYGVCH
jgi:hypothetical protein